MLGLLETAFCIWSCRLPTFRRCLSMLFSMFILRPLLNCAHPIRNCLMATAIYTVMKFVHATRTDTWFYYWHLLIWACVEDNDMPVVQVVFHRCKPAAWDSSYWLRSFVLSVLCWWELLSVVLQTGKKNWNLGEVESKEREEKAKEVKSRRK